MAELREMVLKNQPLEPLENACIRDLPQGSDALYPRLDQAFLLAACKSQTGVFPKKRQVSLAGCPLGTRPYRWIEVESDDETEVQGEVSHGGSMSRTMRTCFHGDSICNLPRLCKGELSLIHLTN